jgi:hypothetical protein
MSESIIIAPQPGPQEQFVNLRDNIPLVFYGGEITCSPRCTVMCN